MEKGKLPMEDDRGPVPDKQGALPASLLLAHCSCLLLAPSPATATQAGLLAKPPLNSQPCDPAICSKIVAILWQNMLLQMQIAAKSKASKLETS